MANRGLFSRLERRTSTAAADPVGSVLEHLRALLNTRKGEAVATPTYGILDFNDIVHTMPAAIHKMQASIRSAILEFEPRMKNVVVTHLSDDEHPTSLRFEISGNLVHRGHRSPLHLHARITPGGRVDVW
jgi:type VI secretion system protein